MSILRVTLFYKCHRIITEQPKRVAEMEDNIMNCLCNIFEDNNIWVWILIILVISALCNNGCGYNNGGGGNYAGDRCCH